MKEFRPDSRAPRRHRAMWGQLVDILPTRQARPNLLLALLNNGRKFSVTHLLQWVRARGIRVLGEHGSRYLRELRRLRGCDDVQYGLPMLSPSRAKVTDEILLKPSAAAFVTNGDGIAPLETACRIPLSLN